MAKNPKSLSIRSKIRYFQNSKTHYLQNSGIRCLSIPKCVTFIYQQCLQYFMQHKTKPQITCPSCISKNTIKRGKRKRKLRIIQQYQCKSCNKFFSPEVQNNKTYPLDIILKALSTYNLGYNLKQTSEKIEKRNKIKIPLSTISNWLNEYKSICTFSRLRKQSLKLYSPQNILFQQTLSHIQPYTFKYHKAKLDFLTKENPKFSALKDYINKISSNKFPHHIFTYNKETNANEQRASQLKFSHLNIKAISKSNQANQLAKLALNLAKNNNDRHTAIQDFMLINDSTTIAVEVPVYLTNWDSGYYKHQRRFVFPLNNYTTPITGHIDILQIRNRLIHILDYKPEASKSKPIEQLTIYSLALSRKLNLPLYHFKCAWFDESSYYEFFPLHVVYPKIK